MSTHLLVIAASPARFHGAAVRQCPFLVFLDKSRFQCVQEDVHRAIVKANSLTSEALAHVVSGF